MTGGFEGKRTTSGRVRVAPINAEGLDRLGRLRVTTGRRVSEGAKGSGPRSEEATVRWGRS